MKSQELISLFEEHAKDLNSRSVQVENKDDIVTLYASEDVKLDRRKNRILLPLLGWVDMGSEIPKKLRFEWAAVYKLDGCYTMSTGTGNPFFCNELPKTKGMVVAVPWNFSQAIVNLFPKLPC